MKALFARVAALPRDKADTLLLLASALLVLAPHVNHLPGWVSLLCAMTLSWRAAITLRGKRMPPSLLLLPLAAAAMFGVAHSYQSLLGRDAGVAMLVLLVAFKMLEMHARRDLFVVVFLCLFLVLTNFFYEQGIGTALLMALSVLALLTAQLSFQFTGVVPPLRQRFLMSAKVLGLATPLALALFFLFPRFDGPLWGMPGDAASARSGLSETMAPGTMANLAQSGEPAFRVRFEGAAPPQEQLYWRGPVLGAYDGRTWTRLDARMRRATARQPLTLSTQGKGVGYEVTLEPSYGHWLFALELPQRLPELDGNAATVSGEFELTATNAIEARLRYRMVSHLAYRLQASALLDDPDPWLQLPANLNPRALLAGLELRAEPDPRKRVDAVLQRFRRDNYVYTLNPPPRAQRRRRFPVRQPRRLLRAFRRRLRVPDARGRRAGAGRHRLPRRRAQSAGRLPHRAPVRRPCLGRSLARAARLGAHRPHRRRGAGAGAARPRRRDPAARTVRYRRFGALHAARWRNESVAGPAALRRRRGQQRLEPVDPELHAAAPARRGRQCAVLAGRLAHAAGAGHPGKSVAAVAILAAPPGNRSGRCAILGPVFAPGPAGTGALGR